MYEIRLFLMVSHKPRRWLIPDLRTSIDVAKSELGVPGDRAEVWSTAGMRPVWKGRRAYQGQLAESTG